MTQALELAIFRRRRVRLVRQTEISECGLACLAMLTRFHGLDVDINALRRLFPVSSRGATLRSLLRACEHLGMVPRPVKLSLGHIADLSLPAILHWDMDHFVVAEHVRRGSVLIHDPASRSAWLSMDETSRHFTGVALEATPGIDFSRGSAVSRLRLWQLWDSLSGIKRSLLQVAVLSLAVHAFALASPYYLQLALDSALPAQDRDLMTVLAMGFGLLVLINVLASLLRSFVLMGAGTTLGFGIAANVARRLFRLPVCWFERRQVGDVLSRFAAVGPLQQALTHGVTAAVLDGMLAVTSVCVMFFYSPTLALLACCALLAYGSSRAVTFGPQRRAQEAALVAGAKEESTLIETLRGIVTLRLHNREEERQALWLSRLTDSTNAGIDCARIGIWQSSVNTLVFGAEGILSLWLAIRMAMDGGFTVGMLFAFAAYKTQFTGRSIAFVDQVVAFRMLRLHLARLSDIALAELDSSFVTPRNSRAPLTGRLELRNLRFRYSGDEPYVLDGLSAVFEPGEHVAITGPSGEGKSTLVKVLLGLVMPESGEILVDGVPMARFGQRAFREQVSAVLQDDQLFAGSFADNIALFDEAPNLQRVSTAAIAAAIHDEILRMPMGYETLVGEMGSSLSGGQRQRVLLARALYRQPRILIVDEATSHLDAVREQQVSRAISELGITRIVIAHRAETVSAAQRVLVMSRGALHEGTSTLRAGAVGNLTRPGSTPTAHSSR